MDDKTKASHEQKSKQIRAILKKWESDWAAGHGGSKPSRQDIKDNPTIAAKYTEYNKMRDILAGKISAPPANEHAPNPKKRRPDRPPTETPLRKNKYAETPMKNRTLDEDQYLSTPAISRRLFSPAQVTSIGPTPQRDGKVLGLFDLLMGKELGTPSKSGTNDPSPTITRGRRRHADDATPSRRRGSEDEASKLSCTPMSGGKRHELNTFTTPLKVRDAGAGAGVRTPTIGSVSKLQFETPAFLRRHTLLAPDEAAAFGTPAPLKLPRKLPGRGLSEIVASLRKVEDDKLDDDDDMAALREAEAAERVSTRSVTAPRAEPAAAATTKESDILAREREAQHIPLGGSNDEGMYDSPEDADHSGLHGQPQIVYKKKGQKRTTRRANMRPAITGRPKAPLDDSQDMVAETQLDKQENMDSEYEDADSTESKKPSVQEGVVRNSVCKVNEPAHTNFRRLKLRSKNMKGKPGGFSRRFGRG
ncbi:DNA replication regulator SLD2 [Beauveria brongniartii RCEF 3172]|uniref:DNA replication regulator SLD2 n=1 Tax=Beauveria brongniartii RCEF 3172 TaxID=1081107 RepID=A0A168EFZ7_9HYPO|nr:DNA replication regulator SLD2 [Beauveria brongniartii RCEF 3172]